MVKNKKTKMLGMHIRMILFLCACITGMILALILHWYQNFHDIHIIYLSKPLPKPIDPSYVEWLHKEGVQRQPIQNLEEFYYDRKRLYNIESKILSKKLSVLCVIITRNSKRSLAINSTWAKHCNDSLFINLSSGKVQGTLKTHVARTSNVFESLCSVYHELCRNEGIKYDWTLVVQDRSFVIVENLRYYVSIHDSAQIHYFGHGMKDESSGIFYNAKDAGILLSKGAMKYLHKSSPSHCKSNVSTLSYDLALGELFNYIGIKPSDTRDHLGRARFNSFNMDKLLMPGAMDTKQAYFHNSMFLSKMGAECCSKSAITFYDVAYKKMFFTYYLLYRLHPLLDGTGIGNVNLSDPAMRKIATYKPNTKPIAVKPIRINLNDINDDGAETIKKGFASMIKKKKPNAKNKRASR